VLGIWFVASKVRWSDTAMLLPGPPGINGIQLVEETQVPVVGEQSAGGRNTVRIRLPSHPVKVRVETLEGEREGTMILREGEPIPHTGEHLRIAPELDVDRDRLKNDRGQWVQRGLKSLLVGASGKWYLLLGAWALLGLPFLVTAIRWRNLMRPQGIDMPLKKCLQLTFVGQFYSIMLPGITGGDLVKIVYAARLTGSKTKSFITIILDRVVGLVALMVIAGTSAAVQLLANQRRTGVWLGAEGDRTLMNVVLFIAVILGTMVVGSVFYFSRRLRRASGLQRLIDHPRMPEFLRHADEVLHAYRGHFGLLVWAFIISLISQLTLPVSAWLSGLAFGMTAPIGYYLAYVPLAILAASLPISPPQGLGFLEWVLNHFFVARGAATASQAFALTQAIRFLPLMWNLVGAYWVVTGSYSRHKTEQEEREIERGAAGGAVGRV
jgi:uncharacterized protein (TIRG00374 family)